MLLSDNKLNLKRYFCLWGKNLICWEFLLPVLWLCWGIFFSPGFYSFQNDSDEGINLIKASLLMEGFNLYGDIWSDQPPFFTALLSTVFLFFGRSVEVARLVVLLFACVILWAGGVYLRFIFGKSYAALAMVIVMLLPEFQQLSVSVMIGLPALAFMMLAVVAVTLWHQRAKREWLLLSGVAFALSVCTKLFVVFMLAVVSVGLIIHRPDRSSDVSLKRFQCHPSLMWFGVVVFLSAMIFLLVAPDVSFSQLLNPHLVIWKRLHPPMVSSYVQKWNGLVILALVGSVIAVLRKKYTVLYFTAWLLGGFLLLCCHKPVWYHHSLLFTIPMGMLLAIVLNEIISDLLQMSGRRLNLRTVFFACLVLICFCYSPLKNPINVLDVHRRKTRWDKDAEEVLRLLRKDNHRSDYIITDMPIYAFRAGLLVPPATAVISWKRIFFGDISEKELIKTIKLFRPMNVQLYRFEFRSLRAYLERYYQPIKRSGRRDVLYRLLPQGGLTDT
jgi:4-amino-4-deoxy-L-arabinose transferase-like glycosyltransferase